ncbi:MAG: hypothetical protein LC645_00530 [Geobacteraceae bacterium]|nr:hypothetical protein [Geobacteraceae bacterium]
MTENDLELAKKIKIKFGTATTEPSSIQLRKIKQDIQDLYAKGATPSEEDWVEIVRRYCPDARSYKYVYEGAEKADLATLNELAKKQ